MMKKELQFKHRPTFSFGWVHRARSYFSRIMNFLILFETYPVPRSNMQYTTWETTMPQRHSFRHRNLFININLFQTSCSWLWSKSTPHYYKFQQESLGTKSIKSKNYYLIVILSLVQKREEVNVFIRSTGKSVCSIQTAQSERFLTY